MFIRADNLWPETEKENLKCTCRHTGEPYWAIPRLRGNNPNLMFWIDDSNKDMRFTEEPLTPMVVDGKISILEGKFWNRNGLAWFKPKAYKPPHILVCVEWGGPNNESRGVEYETLKKKSIYSKRWEHPSGKSGVNWYVFRRNFSMEDMLNDSMEEKI